MLTKWIKAASLIRNAGNAAYSPLPSRAFPGYGSQKGSIEAKDVGNVTRYLSMFCNTSFDSTFRTDSSLGIVGVYVGSDGTPATDTDYKLGSVITALTGSSTANFVYDPDTNKTLLNIDITLSNNTTENITIREVGYVVGFYASDTLGGNVTNTVRNVLGDRTVLDAPMTIASGAAGVLRYQFQYPGLILPTE